MGSIVGMMNEFSLTTRKQKISFLITGIVCSQYLTDFLIDMLTKLFPTVLADAQMHSFDKVASFLVGLLAAQLIQATYKVIKSGSVIGQLFSIIKGRLGL